MPRKMPRKVPGGDICSQEICTTEAFLLADSFPASVDAMGLSSTTKSCWSVFSYAGILCRNICNNRTLKFARPDDLPQVLLSSLLLQKFPPVLFLVFAVFASTKPLLPVTTLQHRRSSLGSSLPTCRLSGCNPQRNAPPTRPV